MSRLQVLYQIVPVLEALEKGQSDISNWLNEANKIIASYGIPSTPQDIAVLQGKHKVNYFHYHKYLLLNLILSVD